MYNILNSVAHVQHNLDYLFHNFNDVCWKSTHADRMEKMIAHHNKNLKTMEGEIMDSISCIDNQCDSVDNQIETFSIRLEKKQQILAQYKNKCQD